MEWLEGRIKECTATVYVIIYIYIYIYIIYIYIAIFTPLMMAQNLAESKRLTVSNASYIKQFPLNSINSIRQLERTSIKICRQNMSILFNEIFINEEMLPKHTHTRTRAHTHTHTHMHACTRLTQTWIGFDPDFECPARLATLKNSDRTKQSLYGW